MTNLQARQHIAELYDRVREFRSDKLNFVLNPDLAEACRKIPELNDLENELENTLLIFNNKLLQFAQNKYPMG